MRVLFWMLYICLMLNGWYRWRLGPLILIVAGMGGKSGNQTSTLVVRGLALGLINKDNARRLLTKELGIALLNGSVWGGVMGVVAFCFKRMPPWVASWPQP